MKFREVDALLREAESRDNLATALKGGEAAKEFIKERKALETAVGGKEKIDRAGKTLDEAEAMAATIVAAAKAEGIILSRAAVDDIKAGTEALQEKHRKLLDMEARLDTQKETNRLKALELENAALAVQGREEVTDRTAMELTKRETKVAGRETDATRREVEIKRFDDWRAAAPA